MGQDRSWTALRAAWENVSLGLLCHGKKCTGAEKDKLFYYCIKGKAGSVDVKIGNISKAGRSSDANVLRRKRCCKERQTLNLLLHHFLYFTPFHCIIAVGHINIKEAAGESAEVMTPDTSSSIAESLQRWQQI